MNIYRSWLMGIIAAISFPTGFCEAHEPWTTVVSFNKTVWPAYVRSPKYSTVTFYADMTAAQDDCFTENAAPIQEFFQSGDQEALRVGEACHRLFTLYKNDRIFNDFGEVAIDFVARHESFHLMGQIFNDKVPMALVFGPRPEPDQITLNFLKIFNGVFLFKQLSKAQRNMACEAVLSEYSKLGPGGVESLRFYASIEWPAEYYAYTSMAQERGDWASQYLEIRRAEGDTEAYSAGIAAGQFLSGTGGNLAWQNDVQSGADMLNLVLRECSSNALPRRSNEMIPIFEYLLFPA